jgi:hypothetical protein
MSKKEFNRKMSKKAQLTIFVILALAIVIVLIIIFFPQIKKGFIGVTPEVDFKTCIENSVLPTLNQTLLRGGTLNPELYFVYENETLDYLCYTQEWYRPCVMQKPFLKREVENQLKIATQAKTSKCLSDLEQNLRNQGYNVKILGNKSLNIVIEPKRARVVINSKLQLEKDGTTSEYGEAYLNTNIKTEAYDLITLASSIQNFEARFGDTDTEVFMGFYPKIKIEKYKQEDGTKVFVLTHRDSKDKLQFATRSVAWPPGYALE